MTPKSEDGTPDCKVEQPKPRMTKRAKTGFAVLLGAASLAALWTVMPSSSSIPPVETSDAKEFQSETKGSGFGAIAPDTSKGAGSADSGFANIEGEMAADRSTLEDQNAKLQDDVKRLQSELGDLAGRADKQKDSLAKYLATSLEKAQAQNVAMLENLRGDFGKDLEALKAKNATLEASLASKDAGDANAAQAEAAQKADLAARRADQEAQLKARIASKGVVFDDGQTSNTGDAAAPADPDTGSRDAAGRNFVKSGLDPVEVSKSQVIANPANTVLQGTMIEATLENAVDSSLPGQLSAVVSYPVWSFDQSQILIPAGSRLFGNYSSDISIGQGRILVGWTRIVTPDGQSVQMQAFGGDQQGRSGLTGKVNTRFAERFGSAALISLLGAMPAVAAAKATDKISSDTAQNVASGLGSASSDAISAYVGLPPVISVNPGAAITVMVDRDLEIY